MSSGGGGGATTTMGDWSAGVAPYMSNMLQRATQNFSNKADVPYQANPFAQVAPLNTDTNAGIIGLRDMSMSGYKTSQAADKGITDTLGGAYLNSNPGSASNGYAGMTNPSFNALLSQGADEITNKYQLGTAADTQRDFALSGAYGGSAHQQAQANNQAGLAKGLDSYTQGMLNTQYNRSADLQSQDLARQSQNYNAERGLMGNAINQGYQGEGAATARGNNLIGIGDIQRLQAQAQLNQGSQNWQDQQNSQNAYLNQFADFITRATGGSTANQTTTTQGYQANPYSGLLGAGITAYGLTR